MPKVPTYDNFQTTPSVPSGARFEGGAISTELASAPGRQVQQFDEAMLKRGNAGMEVAIKEAIHTQNAAYKEADIALADMFRDIKHNPESGYMQSTGKNAVDMYPTTKQALHEAVRKAGENLQGAQAKEAFHFTAQQRLQHALTEIDTHAASQTRIYNVQASKARIIASESDMLTSFADWKMPGSYYEKSDATRQLEVENIIQLSVGANADPAMKAAIRLESSSRAHLGVIDQMLASGNADAAREYFTAKGKEIEPSQHDNVNKALASVGIKGKAMSYADELMAVTKGYTERMKKVQTDFAAGKISADERQIVESRIDHARAVQNAQRSEWEHATIGQAQDHILKGGSLDTLPPALYANLKASGHLGSVAAFARVEGKPKTDYETYYDMRRMAAEEPAAFARLDLLKARHELSPEHWRTLVDLQSRISSKDAQMMDHQAVLSRTVKSIRADMQAAGLDLSPKEGSDPAKKLAKFNASLIDALDSAQRHKQGPLSFDEARKIGMSLLKEGWEQDGGFLVGDSFKKRRFESKTPDKFYSVPYRSIPPESRTEIESSIRRKGRNPTSAEVERIYQQALDAGVVK